MVKLTETEIEDLAQRHPLPDGVPDAVLNRTEIAEFFAVNVLTITAWMSAGMPVQQEGGQGQPYEFRAAHCWAWKQARDRSEAMRSAEARATIEGMRLALVGGGNGDTIEALDPKQRREIYAAQIEHERMMTHRKQLLRREDVLRGFEAILMIVRDVLESAPDRVERIEAMPPKAVDAFIDVCDGVITEIERRLQAWIAEREVVQPPREDLFGQPAAAGGNP